MGRRAVAGGCCCHWNAVALRTTELGPPTGQPTLEDGTQTENMMRQRRTDGFELSLLWITAFAFEKLQPKATAHLMFPPRLPNKEENPASLHTVLQASFLLRSALRQINEIQHLAQPRSEMANDRLPITEIMRFGITVASVTGLPDCRFSAFLAARPRWSRAAHSKTQQRKARRRPRACIERSPR